MATPPAGATAGLGSAAPGGAGRFRLHRRPRDHPPPVPAGEIRIAPPPPLGRAATQGWPMLLPLLSGAGSLPLLLGSPSSGRRWLLLGMAASLLLSTGAGLSLRLLARRAAGRTRRRERARYLAHLQDVAVAAAQVATLQRAAAEHLHPDLRALPATIDAGDRVWERAPGDEDFLEVRLGLGPVGLAAPVHLDVGRDPLADHDLELLAAARGLARRCSRLDGMPVTVSLRGLGVLTIRGRQEAARCVARSVLLRSATFHAPRDLRVLALFSPDAAPDWEWLKWLPHARDDGVGGSSGAATGLAAARSLAPGSGRPRGAPVVPRCLLAATARQAAELLERELGPRPAHRGGGAHLLVVVDGYAPHGPVGRLPMLDALLRAAPALDATTVCLVDRAADEPSATRLRVELDDRGGLTMTEVAPGGHRIGGIRADRADLPLSEAVARRLAPLWLDDPSGRPPEDGGPGSPRLLDVLGLPDPEAIDPSGGWHPRPGPEYLRVPIGQPISGGTPAGLPGRASPGQPVVLDLREAAEGGMGPHGLLVGATGSGKSELLRTIVAGLALTHPPERLAFVLVDFKGGAAFAGLAGLPHTAGLITNLQAEPTMVDRARIALRGEQQRRQRLLRDAGDLDSVASYQRLRSADQRLEPLPRLLVVVDEFGELLAAHPEFLDVFTAIGRTGRSLGIHLLLASQRLDEGRLRGLDSHLRYRICLRTFSPAESAAVLGTPDAYHLPPSPGHGLLKIDSGPGQPFRGLLVSTPAVEEAAVREPGPPASALVLPFDPIEQPVRDLSAHGPPSWSAVPDMRGGRGTRDRPDAALGDLDERRLVGRGDLDERGPGGRGDLAAVAAAMAPLSRAGRRAHRIWLPPLAPTITLGQALRPIGPPPGPGDPAWLRVPVGIVDRPFDQSQEPLLLDFTGRLGHLALAGAPRSGKSTLLATMVAAFALTHRPEQAQFYCVDLGGGLLHALARLPHVGAVLGAHEPTEIRRLVRELRAVATAREEAFRRHRVASMAAWHARRATEPALDPDGYGEVFLVVDNWSRLRQELGDLEHEIESLAATGLHYGVHLVVAASRWADLRLSLRDNLGGRLELRLNDPIESEVGRAAAARLPDRIPGRGLTADGHEFQVALPVLRTPADTHGLPGTPDLPGTHGLLGTRDPASGPPDLAGAHDLAAHPAIDVREVARRAVRSAAGVGAPPLRPLPTLVRVEHLDDRSAPSRARGAAEVGGVPFAIHDHRLEVVRLDLAVTPHFLVIGDPECGKTATLRCLAKGLMARHPPDELRLLVVDYRRTLLDLADAPHCDAYACAPSTTTEAVDRLQCLLDRRLPRSARSPEPRSPEPRPPAVDRRPRHVLVVDDYDLVATTRGNPLEPLLDLVAQGRDHGLHVLLARPVSGTARSSFEPFYQRLRETGCPGLIMSGDPREGPLLGGQTATPQPAGRGHLVTRHGRSGLIQVAWSPPGPAAVTPPAAGPPPATASPAPASSASASPFPAAPASASPAPRPPGLAGDPGAAPDPARPEPP